MEEVESVAEGFADDFLKMAKEKNPNARISTADQRKKEAEELAKKRAHLKPAGAGPSGNPRPLGGYDPKSGRSYSEEVEGEETELDEGVTVLSGRPTTHAEHHYSTSAGSHSPSHVEKTLGLKRGSISKDKKTYIKHGDVHVRTTPAGKHVHVSLVRKFGKFGQDTSKHDQQRESLRSKLLKTNEEVELDEGDELGIRMGSSGPGFNKTPAGKAREVKRKQEHLKGQMKFTKSQGGVSGPKGKLPEEVEESRMLSFGEFISK